MERNHHEDRRAVIPQTSGTPSRQQLLRKRARAVPPVKLTEEPETETVVTQCNRCDKDFVQKKARDQKSARGRVGRVARLYKLCEHCREMGKGRSRRWQMKTREHGGLCRRCGVQLMEMDTGFVLCGKCRKAFRDRKHRRITEGKCIQCCEPLTEEIEAENDKDMGGIPATTEKAPLKRRCQKCREWRNAKGQVKKPFTSEFIQSMYK